MVTTLLIMILFAIVVSHALLSLKITQLKQTIMAEGDEISGHLDRIDKAHDGLKKDLDFIKSKLPESGGLDAATTAAIKARVTAMADKFEALDAETDSDEETTEEG